MSDKSDSGSLGHRPTADDVRSVLDAETAIKRKVDGFRADLAESVAEEQARAHRIEHRTSDRLSRLHARCDQSMEEQIARMQASAELPQIQPDESDRKSLRDAVAELAARLTGAADG
ncbi:MAG: hypothetical protein V2J20_04515 [Wenzhouxiangella sp.]|nr:hypothetical protein [Wenzhouxiangella sp.]